VPAPSSVSRPYWDAARRGELVFQRCARCGAIPAKPAGTCGVCGGRDLTWNKSSGLGTLYSWTVVWRPQHPTFRVPYAPAIMAVEEGWWLLTSVVGCVQEDLEEGMALEVVFHPAGSDIWLPYAQPRSGGADRP
jgi:uncharacterized OB-fold protein